MCFPWDILALLLPVCVYQLPELVEFQLAVLDTEIKFQRDCNRTSQSIRRKRSLNGELGGLAAAYEAVA